MRAAKQAPVGGMVSSSRTPLLVSVLATLPFLAACSVSAIVPGQKEIDRTAVTGSIPEDVTSLPRPGPASGGDEEALAVALGGQLAAGSLSTPFPWQSVDGERRGTVTFLAGEGEDGCRGLITTRESFDGVALYRGRLCLDDHAGWQVRSFEPFDG
ncbi:outer membrane surface antigen [Nitratireductor indicus]|nr:outer membrane surface antigen [Nitratireductor indicus]